MIVKIIIKSLESTTKVLAIDGALFLNGKKTKTKVNDFMENLFTIIGSWKNKLINLRIKDGESYSIRIKEGNHEISYIGKNKFPNNYNLFKKLIDEIK